MTNLSATVYRLPAYHPPRRLADLRMSQSGTATVESRKDFVHSASAGALTYVALANGYLDSFQHRCSARATYL